MPANPPPHSTGRPVVGTSPTAAPFRHLALASPQLESSPQGAFSFLSEVSERRVERRETRVRRPHLRGRTAQQGEQQLVLPFRRQRGVSLLSPERAEALEVTLRETKRHPAGSKLELAAAGVLLRHLEPFLVSAAQDVWASHPRTHHTQADLEQEARVHVLGSAPWRGFQPGRAGPGKTLFPAYVLRAVRQHLHRKVEDAAPVHVTDWGRKVGSRARRRSQREGIEMAEALRAEGADTATAHALAHGQGGHAESLIGFDEVDELDGAGLGRLHEQAMACWEQQQEADERREQLARQCAALRAMKKLPQLQRLAVAAAVGLTGKRLSDAQLAKQQGCAPVEVAAARAAGLAALRSLLEEAP